MNKLVLTLFLLTLSLNGLSQSCGENPPTDNPLQKLMAQVYPVKITGSEFGEKLKILLEEKIDQSTDMTTVKTYIFIFSAKWCGACKSLNKELKNEVTRMDKRIEIYKLDYDENVKLAKKLGIQFLPAIFMIRGGEEIGRINYPESVSEWIKTMGNY